MDFKLHLGILLAILGVFVYLFFSMWPSVVMCITMGYLFQVWDGVGAGIFFVFFFCDKYLY